MYPKFFLSPLLPTHSDLQWCRLCFILPQSPMLFGRCSCQLIIRMLCQDWSLVWHLLQRRSFLSRLCNPVLIDGGRKVGFKWFPNSPLNISYSLLKRIKYEIRLGEPNRPMSTGPKTVEPILCVGPLTEWRPRLAHQVSDSWKLALQGEDLLCKEKTCSAKVRLALQGKEARPHYYKKPQHPHKKVRVTDFSLAF